MQHRHYEFAFPRAHERCPTGRGPRPRTARPERTGRPVRQWPALGRMARRRETPLAIHEYLELEFTVETRS